MNALAQIGTSAFALNASQLSLVKNTIAKDCNDQEFNLFIEVARGMGLNPFMKQILPMVFGKKSKDADKRRMSIIVTRDGLRVIAARCRDYRPASEPPGKEFDESLKSSGNPKGIVKVTVCLWKQDAQGQWWPVAGEAYWDEFAPLKFSPKDWEEVPGEFYPDGNPVKRLKEGAVPSILDTDGNWGKMPIVMITKCAEAQALRAGWPEQFSGVYVEEEMHRTQAIELASEIVQAEAAAAREAKINKEPSLLVCFDGQTAELVSVPVSKLYDRVMEWTRGRPAATISEFVARNRHPLREFWAKAPTDALALKKELESASKPKAVAGATDARRDPSEIVPETGESTDTLMDGMPFDLEKFLAEVDAAMATGKTDDEVFEIWDGFDVEATLTEDEHALQRAFDLRGAHVDRITRAYLNSHPANAG